MDFLTLFRGVFVKRADISFTDNETSGRVELAIAAPSLSAFVGEHEIFRALLSLISQIQAGKVSVEVSKEASDRYSGTLLVENVDLKNAGEILAELSKLSLSYNFEFENGKFTLNTLQLNSAAVELFQIKIPVGTDCPSDSEKTLVRLELLFSLPSLWSFIRNGEISKFVSSLLTGVEVGNFSLIISLDEVSGDYICDCSLDKLEFKFGDEILSEVRDVSLSCKAIFENGKPVIKNFYITSAAAEAYQSLVSAAVRFYSSSANKKGVYDLRVALADDRIILRGNLKKIVSVPFSAELKVYVKKNVARIEIDKLDIMNLFAVPKTVVQNILMNIICDKFDPSYVKSDKKMILINLRRLIPSFADYNPYTLSLYKGRASFCIYSDSSENKNSAGPVSEANVADLASGSESEES